METSDNYNSQYTTDDSNKDRTPKQQNKQSEKTFSKFEYKFSINNLSSIIPPNILQKINYKSNQCRHQYGCIDNLYLKTFRGFLWGYLSYSTLAFLQTLKKKQLSGKKLVSILSSPAILRFSMFLTIFNFIVNGVQCGARSKNDKLDKKQQKILTSLAGFLAGYFALMSQSKSSRKTWTIFALTRALDFCYKNAVNKGYLPYFSQFYTVLFAFINIVTVYAYTNEPSQVFRGIINFYDFVFNGTVADESYKAICVKHRMRQLASKGIDPSADEPFLQMILDKAETLYKAGKR